jgi:surface-anchored protein
MSVRHASSSGAVGFVAWALVMGVGHGRAESVYTAGHADIGVGYIPADKQFDPHWHTHPGATVNGVVTTEDGEYEPATMKAQTWAQRLTPSGGGGLAGLLGVPNGTKISVMGSTTYPPNLGFATEELNPADWTTPITIRFDPLASTLPSGAAFGLYSTNIGGTTVVDRLFSSFDAGATEFGNTLLVNAGEHAHYQWGFTQQGTYDLKFTWTGTHVTDGPISTSATFRVQAVPEPSTLALVGIAGGATVAGLVRRRRRRAAPSPQDAG